VLAALTPQLTPGTPERVKAQEPRLAWPARRYGDEKNGKRNGMWVHPSGNSPDTFREEKAPKGEIPRAPPV
jgi:hypothetical protein